MVWVLTLQSSTQNKINEIKLLTGKLVIENEVMENEIKMKLKFLNFLPEILLACYDQDQSRA